MSRIGGHLLVECLEAAGAEACFGVPGIHGLAIWDGLVDSPVRFVGMRTELAAGFAADGYARTSRRPGVLLTTTGPGSFVATCALMEARTAYVPVVNIVSQVPRAVVGTNRGFLHELPTQSQVLASFAKWHAIADGAEDLPRLVQEAFSQALAAPQGPVVLEIPVDILAGETSLARPTDLLPTPAAAPTVAAELLDEAAALLTAAERPVLWGGGGVLRSGASDAFRALAERLDAVALTTYMGKGAIPGDHPLSGGSGCDEGGFAELLRTADVVLCVGTELGAETTSQWTLSFEGRLIQVDVRAEHLGVNFPALGLCGDAGEVLLSLAQRVPAGSRGGPLRASELRQRIETGLAGNADAEIDVVRAIRAAVPRDGVVAFDMTIAGYVAAPFMEVYAPDTFLYPLGSGTLGYAWPAAIGAKVARPEADVLAVHGDGGVMYCLLELLSARQNEVGAKLLVIDDNAYGILKVYQDDSFGRTTAVDLVQPDFPALARSLGVPVHEAVPGELAGPLSDAMAHDGPAFVHLPQTLAYPTPTA